MKSILLTFRRLNKNNIGTLLGIAGLVVGLVCVLYIFLWATDEASYDRFHEKIERMFVVHAYLDGEGAGKMTFSGCPPAVAPAIKAEYPEVEESCRYIPPHTPFLVANGDKKFMENVAFADFSLFDICSFPFVSGNRGDESAANRVVLSERTAQKYFGANDPVGQVLRFDNRMEMVVVGVIKNIPAQSSIKFSAIIPIQNLAEVFGANSDFLLTWYNNGFFTLGLLKEPSGYDKVASTITRRIQQEMPESTNYLRSYKFKDRYLYEWNNIRNIYIYTLIGLLVLLAAVFNFINLSTARSSKQARETGVRKAMGASRWNLVALYYTDVAVICTLAFVLAIAIAFAGLPLLNQAIGKAISFFALFSVVPLSILFLILLLTIILSGSYPAIYLSSFSPKQTLTSNFQSLKSGGWFRNALVVMMFMVSIGLLTSTYVIRRQTQFLQQMDLGFEKDQLMYVALSGQLREKAPILKQEVGQLAGVLAVSNMSNLPTMIGNNGEGWDWEGRDPLFKPLVTNWEVDKGLLETLGATMVEGDFPQNGQSGVVINKTFANLIGWDHFTGKTIANDGQQYKVLGVMNDIHFNSLSESIMPLVITVTDGGGSRFMVVKMNPDDGANTLQRIIKVCNTLEPVFPVDYGFLNDQYEHMLIAETNMNKLVGVFSVFAVVVLCLGLLGMVMFLVEQRIKEIGIRKCLGEDVSSIIRWIVKPFIVLGMVATAIAIPFSWYAMSKWLQNYPYHIRLDISIFIVSGLLVIALAVLTVAWQSWRAAIANPVDAIKTE